MAANGKVKFDTSKIFVGTKEQNQMLFSGIRGIRRIIFRAMYYLLLFDLAFVFLYPFITMIVD